MHLDRQLSLEIKLSFKTESLYLLFWF